MGRIKWLFQQAMMISFGILVGLSIEAIYYQIIGDSITLAWYHPISILIAGVLCSLPSIFLELTKDLPKNKNRLGIALHFVFLFIIVMIIGYVFKWYRHLDGALFVAIEYVGVYIFVWLASMWIGLVDEKKINDALDSIRDED